MADPAAAAAVQADFTRRIATLSTREREVLVLSAKGMTKREIADLLSRSMYTVDEHRKKIQKKLDVSTIIEAAVIGAKAGVL